MFQQIDHWGIFLAEMKNSIERKRTMLQKHLACGSWGAVTSTLYFEEPFSFSSLSLGFPCPWPLFLCSPGIIIYVSEALSVCRSLFVRNHWVWYGFGGRGKYKFCFFGRVPLHKLSSFYHYLFLPETSGSNSSLRVGGENCRDENTVRVFKNTGASFDTLFYIQMRSCYRINPDVRSVILGTGCFDEKWRY